MPGPARDHEIDWNPLTALLGEISITLGGIRKHVEDYTDAAEAQLRNEPTNIPVYGVPYLGSATTNPVIPASGPLLLSLDGPQVGNRWVVKRLWVSDAGNAAATMAGQAYFYVGQAIGPSGSLATWVPVPPSSGRWIFPNLPNATTFTSDAIVVKATDSLFCVITGGTVGQNVICQGEVINEAQTTAVITVT